MNQFLFGLIVGFIIFPLARKIGKILWEIADKASWDVKFLIDHPDFKWVYPEHRIRNELKLVFLVIPICFIFFFFMQSWAKYIGKEMKLTQNKK